MFNPPRAQRDVSVSGDSINLRFEQAPVADVVHAILGDILGLSYVVAQSVTGEVTIHTNKPLPREQVLPVLEAVLEANGIYLVVDHLGVVHVGPPEALRGVAPSLGDLGGRLPAGQNLLVVPLQYVGATEMADILRPLADPDAFVRIDSVRNLLILAGTRSRLASLVEVVQTFDVDVFKGMSIGLFPLKYASVQEVEQAMSALFGGETQQAAPRSTGGGDAAQREEGRTTVGQPLPAIRLIPIERMNALLVVAPRAHLVEQASEWIQRFDQPTRYGDEPQLFVYPVNNGSSTHLARLLNGLFGGGETQRSFRPDSGVAPGLTESAVGFQDRGSLFSQSDRMGRRDSPYSLSRLTSETETLAPSMQVILGNDVRVVADEVNNALLIYASPREYGKIEAALRRLDLAPTQVLIEASILEVTLVDEFEFGLQWFFHGGLGRGLTGRGVFNPNPTGGIGPNQPGFSYTVLDSAGEVRAVLNMLAQRSLLNVISSPSVMVLDNHNAQIHVGDQQPVRSSTTITDGGTTTSSIEFKDTGVMLSVTPSVNAGGLITMSVNQGVTDVGAVDEATGQRSFLQREIASRVAVRSGETIVLGGLIRDNASRGNLGVPVLKDIPLIGALFGTTTRSTNRTELIVLITPRALQNDEQLRSVSNEMRRRVSKSFSAIPGWSDEGSIDHQALPVR